MTPFGFQITYLALKGTDVADATVNFGTGLNVISGPSDTGKTFISECINYAFGSSKRPSAIPEAQPYESVELGIKALSTGDHFQIKRNLRGGVALLTSSTQEDRILGETHDAGNEDTISYFFLTLCGFNNRLVRTNASGKTRQLSFRDIVHLIIVTEEEIIRKYSPLRSGQFPLKTVEDSVFRLLLTGGDDASVIAAPDPKTVNAENKGKEEVLELLIKQAHNKLEQIAPGKSRPELTAQQEMIDASLSETLTLVSSTQQAASDLEENRKSAWTTLRENQSSLAVHLELLKRFTLLKSQYISDLRRLESIAEAGIRLAQLDQTQCPVCGAEAEHHSKLHPDNFIEPDKVAEACDIEADRLQLLLTDLDQTISQNVQKMEILDEKISSLNERVETAESELTNHFKPRLNDALSSLQESREFQIRIQQALDLHSRIDDLEELLNQFNNRKKTGKRSKFNASADSSVTEELAIKVEELLRAWQFPDLERVTFNTIDQDIQISGRNRSDHGKGVRAITHAAFTIGLMYYCVDKSMPHPGVVIVDSPLVVYREPDSDEVGFTRNLKDLAYSFLASQQTRGQVIVLENEDPPNNLPDTATIIRFTGASHGHKGFIPPSPNSAS